MEKILYDKSKLIDAYENYPSKSDYNLALRISTELLKIGKPIPASAIAINNVLQYFY